MRNRPVGRRPSRPVPSFTATGASRRSMSPAAFDPQTMPDTPKAARPRKTRRPTGVPSMSPTIRTPSGLGTPPSVTGRLAAVAHAGVLHAEDGRLLVGPEPGVDHLADEERVASAVDRLAQLAVDPGGGDVEDRRARPPVMEGEPVHGLAVGVDLHRLDELAD